MAKKVLAMTYDGKLTYCTASPGERGKGRCNHIFHQREDETQQEFYDRCVMGNYSLERENLEDDLGDLEEITSRKRFKETEDGETLPLEDGGYFSLASQVWTLADTHEFAKKYGLNEQKIRSIFAGNSVVDEDGNIILAKNATDKSKTYLSSAEALNKLADKYGFRATNYVYVMPANLRGTMKGELSSIDRLYQNMFNVKNSTDANKVQRFFNQLQNNENMEEYKMKPLNSHGFAVKSIGGTINGKHGLMRKFITGQYIPYSGRGVIEPDINVEYGTCEIPAEMAATVFEPRIKDYLSSLGKSPHEIETFLNKFKNINDNDNSKCTAFDIVQLDNIMRKANCVHIINRQPSLHSASEIAMETRISGAKEFVEKAARDCGTFTPTKLNENVRGRDVSIIARTKGVPERLKEIKLSDKSVSANETIRFSQLNWAGLNADADGDTAQIVGINSAEVSDIAIKEMSAYSDIIKNNPKFQDESLISATKDAWFGLQSIFSAH